MSKRQQRTHLCVECGKASRLEVVFEKGVGIVNSEHPRECRHCKELATYALTPFGNYGTNFVAVLKRIKLLEERVKELEG